MQKILKIARREYIETAKTKTFILGLLIVPCVVAGMIYFTSRASEKSPQQPLTIAISDLSGKVFEAARGGTFSEYNQRNAQRQIQIQQLAPAEDPNATVEQGKEQLRVGRFDAYIVLDEGIVQDAGKIRFYTCKPNPGKMNRMGTVEYLMIEAVRNLRYEAENLSSELVRKLQSVQIDRIDVGEAETEEVQSQADSGARFMLPFFFMFLVYIGLVGTGQHLISSMIEEKGSRVIEVLLSAVSPFELMAGKIVGLAGVGLTIIGVWAGLAYAAASWHGMNIKISGDLMVYLAVYYVLGYLLFGALFAGAGSICNTIKETQGLMMPIMMVVIVPMISWRRLVDDPDGGLARALSFVPPLTSMVMVLRISAGSEVWIGEILGSMALLAATVVLVMWAAAKVFRTGILMYGKRPSLREVFRWLRER
ncbi:MAG TPA: ABC transporter permease [Sedimentisphaerales bacterium]|nr:ABC transporter permease [Sedimentisphaerales bacterium]